MLASCGSAFTIEDAGSPTPDLVPSQNHPDDEPTPPRGAEVHMELEQHTADQLFEAAELSIAEGKFVDLDGSEVSPTPNTDFGQDTFLF